MESSIGQRLVGDTPLRGLISSGSSYRKAYKDLHISFQENPRKGLKGDPGIPQAVGIDAQGEPEKGIESLEFKDGHVISLTIRRTRERD